MPQVFAYAIFIHYALYEPCFHADSYALTSHTP